MRTWPIRGLTAGAIMCAALLMGAVPALADSPSTPVRALTAPNDASASANPGADSTSVSFPDGLLGAGEDHNGVLTVRCTPGPRAHGPRAHGRPNCPRTPPGDRGHSRRPSPDPDVAKTITIDLFGADGKLTSDGNVYMIVEVTCPAGQRFPGLEFSLFQFQAPPNNEGGIPSPPTQCTGSAQPSLVFWDDPDPSDPSSAWQVGPATITRVQGPIGSIISLQPGPTPIAAHISTA